MRIVDNTLLHLTGQAFHNDLYAPDQHAVLRWYHDPRLGLTRKPFVLERRHSLLGTGLSNMQVVRDDAATFAPSGSAIIGDQVAIDTTAVPAEQLDAAFGQQQPPPGAISAAVDMLGGRAHTPAAVCWARITVLVNGGGPLLIAAQRDDRRQRMTIATDTAIPGTPVVFASPRIDRLVLWGDLGDPKDLVVETVDIDSLDAAPGWGGTNHIPIITPSHLTQMPTPAISVEAAARAVVTPTGFPGPRAQHPLDESPAHDPSFPTPATATAVDNRYITPWLLRQQAAVRRILDESAQPLPTGGRLHQSEIKEIQPLTHFGNDDPTAQPSVPSDLTGATFGYSLLHFLLLAAASDLQVAKLLGLAAVPEEPMIIGEAWDYRITGEWEPADLLSWLDALRRQIAVLHARAAAPDLQPSRADSLRRELDVAQAELANPVSLEALLSAAGAGQPVSISAFAFGIQADQRAPYDPPTGLSLSPRGSAAPGRRVGAVDVEWQLRRRFRTSDDAQIPCGAAVAQISAVGQRFLNPDNPDPALAQVPQPILPAADNDAPVGGGRTRVTDRSAPLNTPVEYRVAECDPFGRWSTWSKDSTQVSHQAPPDSVPCEASLQESPSTPGTFLLTVGFDWNPAATWDGGLVSGDLAQMSFVIGVRRTLPAPTRLRDRGAWATLERQPGTKAVGFTVAGSSGAALNGHDGMQVRIEQPTDIVVGNRLVRRFAVTFDGLQLSPSPSGRSRCYVAIATSHATEGFAVNTGVPALAEHIPTTPPTAPTMPPDPIWASTQDAENRSTVRLQFTVPDDGAATAVRYQILRAGENEVVAAAMNMQLLDTDVRKAARAKAHSDYLAATDLAHRADALKRLSVLAEDVFTIAVDRLPAVTAGTSTAAVCELTGSLTTLSVLSARGMSEVGNSSTWPTSPQAFAVVAVPRATFPATPVVLRAHGSGGTAQLQVAKPSISTAAVSGYELYRTSDPERARSGDHRRMALTATIPVSPATWQGPAGAQFVAIEDPTAQPDRRYYFVVVARGQGGGGNPGTRSRPSALVGVDVTEPEHWQSLRWANTAGVPAIARRPDGTLDVLIRDTKNRMRINSRTHGSWSNWELVPIQAPAPGVTEVTTSDPAAWAVTDDGPEVVAATSAGILRHTNAVTGTGWQDIQGSQGITAPALTGDFNGMLLVGLDTKRRLRWARRPVGATWTKWTTVTGLDVPVNAPAVAVDGNGDGHLAAITDDGTCWYTWQDNVGWRPWTNLGGGHARTRPLLLAVTGQGIQILALGQDGQLRQRPISQIAATDWAVVDRHPPGPVAGVDLDNSVELVGVDTTGAVLHRWITPAPIDAF